MPAASVLVPGNTPEVGHSPGCGRGWSTTSVGHTSEGNSSPGATTAAHSRRPGSYNGEHWLAEWWSTTYRPVSRCTRKDDAISSIRVRTQT